MQQLICIFDSLLSRRIDAFQRILITEFFPFVRAQCVIRHVLVPERSDKDEYLIRLDAFIQSLHNV